MTRDIARCPFVRGADGFSCESSDSVNFRFAVKSKDEAIDRPHDVNRIGAGQRSFEYLRAGRDELHFSADQRLDRLIRRDVSQIDVYTVLSAEPVLLGHP